MADTTPAIALRDHPRRVDSWPRPLAALVCGALLICGWRLSAFADEPSPESSWPEVHEVEADAAGHVGRPMMLMGRFFSAGGGRMRLVGSQIEFRVDSLPRRIRRHLRVRVFGQLSQRGSTLVFDAKSVALTETELERFDRLRQPLVAQRSESGVGDFASLKQLALWLRSMGERYNDSELLDRSREAVVEAYRWELEDAQRRSDAARMLVLADEGSAVSQTEEQVTAIRHRAIRIKWKQFDPPQAGRLRELARLVTRLLPGAAIPIPDEEAALIQAYSDAPLDLYGAADPPLRQMLHRALWVALITQAVGIEARGPRVALQKLAEELERSVPERRDMARDLRLRHLDQQADRLAALSRTEVLVLHEQFASLGRPNRGTTALREWLELKQSKLVAQDAEGRIELAEDYLRLLSDAKTAAALYLDAAKLAPASREVADALTGLGYVRVDGQWRHREALEARAAAREGGRERVGLIDLTEEDVIRRFKRPDGVVRTVSARHVTEQWVYEGPPSLVIYMRRDRHGGPARVVAVRSPSAAADRR